MSKCRFGRDAADGECDRSCGDAVPNDCICLSQDEVMEEIRKNQARLNLIGGILGGVGVFCVCITVIFLCDGFKFLGCANLSADLKKLFKIIACNFSAAGLIAGIILLSIASTKDPESYEDFYVGCGNSPSSHAGDLLVRPFFATALFLLCVF